MRKKLFNYYAKILIGFGALITFVQISVAEVNPNTTQNTVSTMPSPGMGQPSAPMPAVQYTVSPNSTIENTSVDRTQIIQQAEINIKNFFKALDERYGSETSSAIVQLKIDEFSQLIRAAPPEEITRIQNRVQSSVNFTYAFNQLSILNQNVKTLNLTVEQLEEKLNSRANASRSGLSAEGQKSIFGGKNSTFFMLIALMAVILFGVYFLVTKVF